VNRGGPAEVVPTIQMFVICKKFVTKNVVFISRRCWFHFSSAAFVRDLWDRDRTRLSFAPTAEWQETRTEIRTHVELGRERAIAPSLRPSGEPVGGMGSIPEFGASIYEGELSVNNTLKSWGGGSTVFKRLACY